LAKPEVGPKCLPKPEATMVPSFGKPDLGLRALPELFRSLSMACLRKFLTAFPDFGLRPSVITWTRVRRERLAMRLSFRCKVFID